MLTIRRLRQALARDGDPGARRARAGLARGGADDAFNAELHALLSSFGGRPTPLTLATRFAAGKRLYLKREDLLHTGAHKLNNALGQALLARRLGKRHIGRDRRGPARRRHRDRLCPLRARVRRLHGREDVRRQSPNVQRMQLLGAEVRPVTFGTATLREATSEAIRDWIGSVETTHYLIARASGRTPAPRSCRSSGGDQVRGAGTAARGRRTPSRRCGRLRRRGLQRDRTVRGVPRRRRRAASRCRGRRSGGLGAGRAWYSTARARPCSRTRTGRCAPRCRVDLGELDYPGVGPGTRTSATPAEPSM